MRNVNNNYDGQIRRQQLNKLTPKNEEKKEQQVQEEAALQEEQTAEAFPDKKEDVQAMQDYAALQGQMLVTTNNSKQSEKTEETTEEVLNDEVTVNIEDIEENPEQTAQEENILLNAQNNVAGTKPGDQAGVARPGRNRKPTIPSTTGMAGRWNRWKEERAALVDFHDAVNKADDVRKKTKKENEKACEQAQKAAETAKNNALKDINGRISACDMSIKNAEEALKSMQAEYEKEFQHFYEVTLPQWQQDETSRKAQHEELVQKYNNDLQKWNEEIQNAEIALSRAENEYNAVNGSYQEALKQYSADDIEWQTKYAEWSEKKRDHAIKKGEWQAKYDAAKAALEAADEAYNNAYDEYKEKLEAFEQRKAEHEAKVEKYNEIDLPKWENDLNNALAEVEAAAREEQKQKESEARNIDLAEQEVTKKTNEYLECDRFVREGNDKITEQTAKVGRLQRELAEAEAKAGTPYGGEVFPLTSGTIDDKRWDEVKRVYNVEQSSLKKPGVETPYHCYQIDNEGNIVLFWVTLQLDNDGNIMPDAYGFPQYGPNYEVVLRFEDIKNNIEKNKGNSEEVNRIKQELAEAERQLNVLKDAQKILEQAKNEANQALTTAQNNLTKVKEDEAKKTDAAKAKTEAAEQKRDDIYNKKPTDPGKFTEEEPKDPSELRKAYDAAYDALQKLEGENPGEFTDPDPTDDQPVPPTKPSNLDELKTACEEASAALQRLQNNPPGNNPGQFVPDKEPSPPKKPDTLIEQQEMIQRLYREKVALEKEKENALEAYDKAIEKAETEHERKDKEADDAFEKTKEAAQKQYDKTMKDIAKKYGDEVPPEEGDSVSPNDLSEEDINNIMSQLGLNNSAQIQNIIYHDDGTYTVTYYDKDSGDYKEDIVKQTGKGTNDPGKDDPPAPTKPDMYEVQQESDKQVPSKVIGGLTTPRRQGKQKS